ncbi:MAG: hypothetical protein IKN43_05870, partial [Selenomonadaceae bacterium]|nr:hypothetical protein [Selenomonadaceae bacterium]
DVENTDFCDLPDETMEEWFDICNNPWHCWEKGKLYVCNFTEFAVKAGLLVEDENDCFDLQNLQEKDRAALLEFTLGYSERGYAQLCRRCAGWADVNPKRVKVAEQAKCKLSKPSWAV